MTTVILKADVISDVEIYSSGVRFDEFDLDKIKDWIADEAYKLDGLDYDISLEVRR